MENSQSADILIFVPQITPRVVYSFEFIFQAILGTKVIFCIDPVEFKQSGLPKINYSGQSFSCGLFLKAHSLLFGDRIAVQEIKTVEYQQLQLFFPTSEDSFLPFDPFAVAFYLVSRYEEYIGEITDAHERFLDSENILVRLGLHQKPIVDQLAYWVAYKVSAEFPAFKIRKRTFQLFTTIDIDNAWAYKNKSLGVSMGAFAKGAFRGKWDEVKERAAVFLRFQDDPYDTYEYILESGKERFHRLLFFFLIADRDRFDKSISHKNKSFRNLIRLISAVCEVGIHPSYSSNEKPWLFETEKKRLENIIRKPVTKSRQHYLKLKFPSTYRTAIKSGITDDYTMGFASLAGFRAGTCTPFPFFDLGRNRQTSLMVHPFQIMDVTLKDYMNLDPEQAWKVIEQLMVEVKNVNGTFVSLFHNESLKESGEWLGWRKVFERVLEKGITLENEQS